MKQKKNFSNLLDELVITDTRLANFLHDTIPRLTAQNVGNIYKEIIGQMTTYSAALRKAIGDVDSDKTSLKGKTQTNDEVMKSFNKTMKDKEGLLADLLGCFDSVGYLDFYANGLTEYGRATRTVMPRLVGRIFKAARVHKVKLSPLLVAVLISFGDQLNG